MVQSHLEYGASVWSSHTWTLVEELEKVQGHAMKRISALADMSYEERLRRLNLPTLVYRRLRGDMIKHIYTNIFASYTTQIATCFVKMTVDV